MNVNKLHKPVMRWAWVKAGLRLANERRQSNAVPHWLGENLVSAQQGNPNTHIVIHGIYCMTNV